jgi:hypothetical protein
MRFKSELVALGVSAPFVIGGLLAVALASGWAAQAAGAATVLGGSVGLASGRWPARLAGWSIAGLGLIALLVRMPS